MEVQQRMELSMVTGVKFTIQKNRMKKQRLQSCMRQWSGKTLSCVYIGYRTAKRKGPAARWHIFNSIGAHSSPALRAEESRHKMEDKAKGEYRGIKEHVCFNLIRIIWHIKLSIICIVVLKQIISWQCRIWFKRKSRGTSKEPWGTYFIHFMFKFSL